MDLLITKFTLYLGCISCIIYNVSVFTFSSQVKEIRWNLSQIWELYLFSIIKLLKRYFAIYKIIYATPIVVYISGNSTWTHTCKYHCFDDLCYRQRFRAQWNYLLQNSVFWWGIFNWLQKWWVCYTVCYEMKTYYIDFFWSLNFRCLWKLSSCISYAWVTVQQWLSQRSWELKTWWHLGP